MSKKNNIIELNGQRYDAVTGARLTPFKDASKSAVASAPQTSIAKTAMDIKSVAKTVRRSHVHRSTAQPSRRTPEHSHTLMRHAVKRPNKASRPKLKAQVAMTESTANLPAQLALKQSVTSIDEKRLQHAKRIPRSRLISRFSAATAKAPRLSAVKPATAPVATPKPTITAHPVTGRQTTNHARHPRTGASDLLEKAMQQAASHREPAPKHRRSRASRAAAIGATVTLTVFLLAVVFMQNLPGAKMQMAAARAGFNASLPSYNPAGYSLGALNYSSGVVAAQFNSNSDQRHYTITQKLSPWDSTALRDNFVAATAPDYQTIQAGGRTVYLYGDRSATWVNGGVWYIIQTDGSLNDHQLIQLASSL